MQVDMLYQMLLSKVELTIFIQATQQMLDLAEGKGEEGLIEAAVLRDILAKLKRNE